MLSRILLEGVKSVSMTTPVTLACRSLNPEAGTYAGEDWQLDFTHLPGGPAFRLLLVLVDTFTGWAEAVPCSSEKAQEVIKVLISEITPRFGLPRTALSESLGLWEANIISTVPGDPSPQARLSEPMDYSGDTCLSWLRKLTFPGKNYYI
jgi:hypothetical protein